MDVFVIEALDMLKRVDAGHQTSKKLSVTAIVSRSRSVLTPNVGYVADQEDRRPHLQNACCLAKVQRTIKDRQKDVRKMRMRADRGNGVGMP